METVQRPKSVGGASTAKRLAKAAPKDVLAEAHAHRIWNDFVALEVYAQFSKLEKHQTPGHGPNDQKVHGIWARGQDLADWANWNSMRPIDIIDRVERAPKKLLRKARRFMKKVVHGPNRPREGALAEAQRTNKKTRQDLKDLWQDTLEKPMKPETKSLLDALSKMIESGKSQAEATTEYARLFEQSEERVNIRVALGKAYSDYMDEKYPLVEMPDLETDEDRQRVAQYLAKIRREQVLRGLEMLVAYESPGDASTFLQDPYLSKHITPGHGIDDQGVHGNWARSRRRSQLAEAVLALGNKPENVFLRGEVPGFKNKFAKDGDYSDEANRLAKETRDFALTQEPRITETIISAANAVGGLVYGLPHRVKTEKSLARKITSDVHESKGKLSMQEAADSLGDVARYTVILSAENYISGATAVLAELAKAGIPVAVKSDGLPAIKNFWRPGDVYDGLNIKLDDKSLGHVEIQFHTPNSITVKNPSHDLFEIYRDESQSRQKKREVWDQMLSLWAPVPRPTGWESLERVMPKAVFDPGEATATGLIRDGDGDGTIWDGTDKERSVSKAGPVVKYYALVVGGKQVAKYRIVVDRESISEDYWSNGKWVTDKGCRISWYLVSGQDDMEEITDPGLGLDWFGKGQPDSGEVHVPSIDWKKKYKKRKKRGISGAVSKHANHNQKTHGNWARGRSIVPPRPGTTPIPEGHIRLYHYTRAGADVIREQGLKLSESLGETYGEPNVVWASGQQPGDFKTYVEFSVPIGDSRFFINKPTQISPDSDYEGKYVAPDGKAYNVSPEGFTSDVGLMGDVKPEEFIAVHEPWHHRYRYMVEEGMTDAVLAGDWDDLMNDPKNPDYGKAIRQIYADAGIKKHASHDQKTHGNWSKNRDPTGLRFRGGYSIEGNTHKMGDVEYGEARFLNSLHGFEQDGLVRFFDDENRVDVLDEEGLQRRLTSIYGEPGPTKKRDAPISRYGLKWSKGNDKNKDVARAKKMPDEKWRALPKQTFDPAELKPTEKYIGSEHVARVLAGEPLREGYDPYVLIDADGVKWIVDGHHRAAMYAALGRDMPAHVAQISDISKHVTHDQGTHGSWSRKVGSATQVRLARERMAEAGLVEPASSVGYGHVWTSKDKKMLGVWRSTEKVIARKLKAPRGEHTEAARQQLEASQKKVRATIAELEAKKKRLGKSLSKHAKHDQKSHGKWAASNPKPFAGKGKKVEDGHPARPLPKVGDRIGVHLDISGIESKLGRLVAFSIKKIESGKVKYGETQAHTTGVRLSDVGVDVNRSALAGRLKSSSKSSEGKTPHAAFTGVVKGWTGSRGVPKGAVEVDYWVDMKKNSDGSQKHTVDTTGVWYVKDGSYRTFLGASDGVAVGGVKGGDRARTYVFGDVELGEVHPGLKAHKESKAVSKHGTHDQLDHGNWARNLRIFRHIMANEGATFDIKSRSFKKDGFAVADPAQAYEAERATAAAKFEKEGKSIIRDFIKQWKAELSEPNKYVGAWLDGGEYYLDVATVVMSESTAREMGEETDQIAIFDLAAGESIYLKKASSRVLFMPIAALDEEGIDTLFNALVKAA